MMEVYSELVGNPSTLLLERLLYLFIGCFFVVALYTGIQRGRSEK